MKDIKQKAGIEKTMKAIDKSAVATEKMKDALVKSKEKAENSYISDKNSEAEYAADMAQNSTMHIARKTSVTAQKIGEWGVKETKDSLIKSVDKLQDFKASKNTNPLNNSKRETIKSAKQQYRFRRANNTQPISKSKILRRKVSNKLMIKKRSAQNIQKYIKSSKKTIKTSNRAIKTSQSAIKTANITAKTSVKTAQSVASATVKTSKITIQTAKVAAKTATLATKAVVKGIVAAGKAAVALAKSVAALIAAGGWIAVFIILIICMFALILGSGRIIKSEASFIPIDRFSYPLAETFSITSYFGYRENPFTGEPSYHSGIDIAAPESTPILASESGVVTVANATDSWGGGYGYYVVIEHTDRYTTLYAHCVAVSVVVGQEVVQGEVIAYVGNTGRSTGNHLHFEVRKNGERTDPLSYFTEKD